MFRICRNNTGLENNGFTDLDNTPGHSHVANQPQIKRTSLGGQPYIDVNAPQQHQVGELPYNKDGSLKQSYRESSSLHASDPSNGIHADEGGADGWDLQDVQPLDAPGYLKGLEEEQGLPPTHDDIIDEDHDSDAEEVDKRVMEQVHYDQEEDRKAAVGMENRPMAPSAAMAKAASSQRARSITSASRPGDTFKCVSVNSSFFFLIFFRLLGLNTVHSCLAMIYFNCTFNKILSWLQSGSVLPL